MGEHLRSEIPTITADSKLYSLSTNRVSGEINRLRGALTRLDKQAHKQDLDIKKRRVMGNLVDAKITYFDHAINFLKEHQRNMHKIHTLNQVELDKLRGRADWTINNLRNQSNYYKELRTGRITDVRF